MSNHRAEHGKVTPGHISMVIGLMVCCQAGSAQVVQQASVHTSEDGTEKLMALCESAMRVNDRAEHGKVTPGHICMVIGPMVCCQAGSAQVVQQASVHTSEGGTEKLLELCERAMRVNHRAEHGKVTPGHISMVIGPMVCCQAGSAQVVKQASVHTSEGGTEKLLALCERAMRVKSSGGTR